MKDFIRDVIDFTFSFYVIFSVIAFLIGLVSSGLTCKENTRLKQLFPTHKLACYLTQPLDK